MRSLAWLHSSARSSSQPVPLRCLSRPTHGAGAIAGGLGLVALSGILKGTSSLIGASAPKVSGSLLKLCVGALLSTAVAGAEPTRQ